MTTHAAPGARSVDVTRPIQAVVFDMDGVLVDSEPLWRRAEREIFGDLGLDLTDADLVGTMGVRIGEVVALWWERRPWEGPPPPEVERMVVEAVVRAIGERGEVRPGAADAVAYFRRLGMRLALASSSPYRLIEAVLIRAGLDGSFGVVHSAQDEPAGKPDPGVYLTTARKLGVPPERCLAVEDSPNGVRAALGARMPCLAVPDHPPPDGRFHGADLVLESLTEVGDWMWSAMGLHPAGAGRA